LEIVKKRFENNPFFKGVIQATSVPQSDVKSDTYNFVYFIETIEHIIPEKLNDQLLELNRIIKKGGFVFLSTPHNEDIPKYEVLCPDCGAIFHRVQHMNSFTVENMIKLMDKAGFDTVLCKATFLGQNTLWGYIKMIMNKILGKDKKPHLIYLGKKR
jgi:hypothetical protein